METRKQQYIVTLTPFGAQQLRALRISQVGREILKSGRFGIPELVPASHFHGKYTPDGKFNPKVAFNPKGYELGTDLVVTQDATAIALRDIQTKMRATTVDRWKTVRIEAKNMTVSRILHALGFKKAACAKFIFSVEPA